MLTYRYRGHGGMPARRGGAETRIEDADPVTKARARILATDIMSETQLKALDDLIKSQDDIDTA